MYTALATATPPAFLANLPAFATTIIVLFVAALSLKLAVHGAVTGSFAGFWPKILGYCFLGGVLLWFVNAPTTNLEIFAGWAGTVFTGALNLVKGFVGA